MQKNHEYRTISNQYYAKDPIPDDEYFLKAQNVSQVPHAPANARNPNFAMKSDSMYGFDTPNFAMKGDSMYGFDTPNFVMKGDSRYGFDTPNFAMKSDSMYGFDKFEDHQQKNFHIMNRHQDKGHQRLPEINKKVHFAEHVEIDKNGKHAVHDEDISVDTEADGFIQKEHKNFDKWETFKRY